MRFHRSLLVLSLVALASGPSATAALAAPSRMLGACNATAAADVVGSTNRYRESLGLPRLAVESRLSAFALQHADDMAMSATLTHSSSGGETFAERARGSTYRFSSMRENIAVEGAPLPATLGADIWTLWRRSPAHDANMRARDVTQIGVAMAAGARGCYASMDLGSPAS